MGNWFEDRLEEVKSAASGTANDINRSLSGTANSINQNMDTDAGRAALFLANPVLGGANYISRAMGAGKSGSQASGGPGIGAQPAQNPAFMGINQSEAFRRLQQQSKTKGASPWAGLATAKQNLMASEGIDEAAKRANSQLGQQMGNLAASGGMTSGARERAIAQAPQNFLNMSAEIGKQKSISGLDIAMEDAKRKQGLLEKVGGLEMRDIEQRNAYDQNLYNQQMQQWAAKQQADATRAAGSKFNLLDPSTWFNG